ncbi:MAG: ribose 5-phosphate isomerase A [Acidobacteria bacterium]|nr:ribose 5-phosphate isomerase A [Acidobacteriota bacterium]
MAAEKAALFLDGVRILGLGTGSTTALFVGVVGEMVQSGALPELVAIPTSIATENQARALGIPLTDLEAHPRVDVTVDGADEVSRELDLIKGRGGALAREKIVASASRELIIVVDDSKLVNTLGERLPLPVEVLPFGWKTIEPRLQELGAEPHLRREGGEAFATDQGNYILDCIFPAGIADPSATAQSIDSIPGVVAQGMFLGMADRVVVAGAGGVRILERP